MGSETSMIYHDIPNDIFTHIFTMMGDKLVVRCSGIDKRLSILSKTDTLWYQRIKRRFMLVKPGEINLFRQYMVLHNEAFFKKHIVDDFNLDMRISDIETSCNYDKSIIMIKSITETPIKFNINVKECIKGKKKVKIYNVVPSINYVRIMGGWYRRIGSKPTMEVSRHLIISSIKSDIDKGYYIVRNIVDHKIVTALLKSSLAKIKSDRQ